MSNERRPNFPDYRKQIESDKRQVTPPVAAPLAPPIGLDGISSTDARKPGYRTAQKIISENV